MTPLAIVAIGMLGGLGAVARFGLDGAVSRRTSGTFPLGTFAVNMAGSLALGVLVGLTTDENALRLLATGLLGSFTTFSTWMLETQRLAEDGEWRTAMANVVFSLLAGVALAWAGAQIGEAL